MFEEQTTSLHYWPIGARVKQISWLVGYHALPVDFVTDIPMPGTPEWESYPVKSPMGQLPVLEDGGDVIGQSGAIFRLLVDKHQLQWDPLEDELAEGARDLFDLIAKAHYADDRKTAMDAVFMEKIKRHLNYIETRLPAEEVPGPGEIAIASVLDICDKLESGCIDPYPGAKELLEKMRSHPGIQRVERVFSKSYLLRE